MHSGRFSVPRKLFVYVLLLLGVLIGCAFLVNAPTTRAVSGINQQINFQGRLLNGQGATVPDGFYNIQFKIYQDGDGLTVGNTTGSPAGVLKWTENYLNASSQGVVVKNGFISVQLGSVTAFGSSVDWNQDKLWLSMNIGSTNVSCTPFASCTPDGEMVPMKRMSSTPYSLNSGLLGGLSSAQFIQSTTTLQSGNIAVQSAGAGNIAALIQGAASQSADVLQIKANGITNPLFKIGSSGAATLQNASDSSAAFRVLNQAGGLILGVDTSANLVRVVAGTVGNISATSGTGALQIGADNTDNLAFDDNEIMARSNGSVGNLSLQKLGGGLNIQANNTLIKPNSNTTSAFQIQPAGSTTPILNVDTLNNQVLISTPTFSTTANDANCFAGGALVAASCTIAAASVNTTSAILVGFNQGSRTASLPDPTLATAGKVVYITAANGSNDFNLLVNGGGVGNSIAMRQNTSATMIWNGNDWTAAGASSSTTLQSAYDNTLQSAGGAELIVSRTSNTNGLTIRDSSTNPVNDTLLSVQSSSAASLFSVNSNVREYASNSGAETAGGTPTTFPSNTWSAITTTPTSANVTRHATAGNYIATGQGSVLAVTPAVANAGVKNVLVNSSGAPTALTANTTYNVSFTARLLSGSFTDMNVQYSHDGGVSLLTTCAASATASTSVWSKVNCTFTTPASGITSSNAILIRQTAGAIRTFYIDNLSVTIAADYNFATDSSVKDQTNFATNWLTVGLGTVGVTRNTSDGYDASDSAQAAVTTGAANAGIRNKLSSNPLSDTLYRVTVYGKLLSGVAFNDFKIRYSYNGSTNTTLSNYVDCVDYNTQTLTTTGWVKVTCYIKTDSNPATNPHVYFAESTPGVRTFAVDTFSMTLSTSTTPNVQIGGGINGGPTTLFTLDKGASAPIASDNDALLGSMYYDTTLGKLQCYEADGWGACGSSPDNVVTISPEYTNAVMHGTGIGTMVSDICSDTLNINDTTNPPIICGTNETYNFYKWTSPQASAQTYSIYVTYQLPNTFKSFASGQTSIMGRTDSANAIIQYQVYRNDATTGLTPCGGAVAVSTGVQTAWQPGLATGGADPSACGFTPGNSIVFKISTIASQNANSYVGNLNFIFSNR